MFRLLGLASCIAGAPSGPGAGTANRAVSFTEGGGYTRINKARTEKRKIVFRKFVQDLKFYFFLIRLRVKTAGLNVVSVQDGQACAHFVAFQMALPGFVVTRMDEEPAPQQ